MILSAVVAVSDNGVIGNEGGIPWRIKGDQLRAKEITMGYPLIMGRKTHQSIGRTLPGRLNVVISRNPDFKVYEGSVLVNSFKAALGLNEVKSAKEVFIMGGEAVFNEAMPMLDKIYLTVVHADVDGDTFFEYKPKDWTIESKKQYPVGEGRPFKHDFLVLSRR